MFGEKFGEKYIEKYIESTKMCNSAIYAIEDVQIGFGRKRQSDRIISETMNESKPTSDVGEGKKRTG